MGVPKATIRKSHKELAISKKQTPKNVKKQQKKLLKVVKAKFIPKPVAKPSIKSKLRTAFTGNGPALGDSQAATEKAEAPAVQTSKEKKVVKVGRKKWRFNPIALNRGVLYIKNLPHGFYETELQTFFAQFGHITRIRVARSARTGRSKGFAFIEFGIPEVAEMAAKSMNNYLMFNKVLKTRYIPPTHQAVNFFRTSVRRVVTASGRVKFQSFIIRRRRKMVNAINRMTKTSYINHVRKQTKGLQKLQKRISDMGIAFDVDSVVLKPIAVDLEPNADEKRKKKLTRKTGDKKNKADQVAKKMKTESTLSALSKEFKILEDNLSQKKTTKNPATQPKKAKKESTPRENTSAPTVKTAANGEANLKRKRASSTAGAKTKAIVQNVAVRTVNSKVASKVNEKAKNVEKKTHANITKLMSPLEKSLPKSKMTAAIGKGKVKKVIAANPNAKPAGETVLPKQIVLKNAAKPSVIETVNSKAVSKVNEKTKKVGKKVHANTTKLMSPLEKSLPKSKMTAAIGKGKVKKVIATNPNAKPTGKIVPPKQIVLKNAAKPPVVGKEKAKVTLAAAKIAQAKKTAETSVAKSVKQVPIVDKTVKKTVTGNENPLTKSNKQQVSLAKQPSRENVKKVVANKKLNPNSSSAKPSLTKIAKKTKPGQKKKTA